MKMTINPFLFRLLLISAWYFSVSSFLDFGFLFGYIVFIPILCGATCTVIVHIIFEKIINGAMRISKVLI